MIGTLVNTATVIAGSGLGLLVHRHLPERMTAIVFQVLGLVTLAIAIPMCLETQNILFAVISLVAGAMVGQWLDIDGALSRFSGRLQRLGRGKNATRTTAAAAENHNAAVGGASDLQAADKGGSASFSGDSATRGDDPATTDEQAHSGVAGASAGRFTEGFITATMIFCVGSMAILGAIEDGIGKTPTLLYTKSIMDGVCAMILTSSFGVGVMFSAISVLVYQGGLTLLASWLTGFMNDAMLADLTGVGGILLLGLGLSLLKIKDIKIVNMLPALVLVVVLTYFFG